MTDNTGTQALWPQMISALAAIDRELGLPDDGCNSTAQTLNAIRLLKMAHRDNVKIATDLQSENAVLAGLLRDCDAVLATIEADDGDEAQKLGDLRMALAYAIDPYKREGTLLRSDEWEDLRDDLHHAAAEIERLRAAETEMLGALDALVSACELPGDHCEVEQALPAAITVIAKALGVPPNYRP